MPYAFQRLAAVVITVIFSPIFMIVAAVILIADGRPVFFRQTRIGLDRRAFRIVKFRTMIVGADNYLTSDGAPLARLTRSGPILRRTGLDEIPQLLNIIAGHMALIGPRAVLPEVATNIPSDFEARFTLLPGVTGLAQVNGRHELPWSKRLAFDVEYVRQRDTLLDLRILIRTIGTTVHATGFSMDRTTHRTDDLGLLRPSPKQRDEQL